MESLAEVPEPNDQKYITFKREEFMQWLGELSGKDLRNLPVPNLLHNAERITVEDAVVIRRQDYFAAPALATYASTIGLATHLTDDPKRRAQLIAIADYFQRQSEIAGDEAWKFPDL